jgi:nitrous oxidase accessory protein NosD
MRSAGVGCPGLMLLALVWSLWAAPSAAQTNLINGNLVVAGHENACTSATGTDAYACNLARTPTTPAYVTGACYQFTADVANTGAASLNLSSMGVKTITKVAGGVTTPLLDNDIRPGQIVRVCYDGTNFQCHNCLGNTPQATVLNVKTYGATGDGTTDDTTAIAAALTAASAGDTIFFPRPAVNYKVTAALAISKALTLEGDNATVKQATAGTKLLVITASNVMVQGLTLSGPQAASFVNLERAIDATGASAAAPLTKIRIVECTIDTWGGWGILMQYVTDFEIRGNRVSNIGYAGIMVSSGLHGTVMGNNVQTITPGSGGLAYGITMTRTDVASYVTEPRTSDVVISSNYVANVPVWEGIECHNGQRLTFTGNTVINTKIGIAGGGSPGGFGAPQDIVITNNVLDSTLTNGAGQYGIILHGVGPSDAPTETAKNGVIMGNVVHGYGNSATDIIGAITLYHTENSTVSGNTIYQPGARGILIYHDNYGFAVTGNTVIDPWTDTGAVGDAIAIIASSSSNTGLIAGNSIRRGSKSASFVLTSGIYIADLATNSIFLGANYSNATTPLNDAGRRAQTMFYAPVKIDKGTGGCLVLRDTNGTSWTKCKTLSGVMTCTTDADGICD